MHEILSILGEQQRNTAEFARLVEQTTAKLIAGTSADPAMQAALNPNNEYVKFDEPVEWKDLPADALQNVVDSKGPGTTSTRNVISALTD